MFEGKDLTVFLSHAGSGKTYALMQALEREIRSCPFKADDYAFVTFTRRAVAEGVHRVSTAIGLTADDLPYFRTIHSLAYRANSSTSKEIFTAAKEREFNKLTGYELHREARKLSKMLPMTKTERYLNLYDKSRLGCDTTTDFDIDFDTVFYDRLVATYNKFKEANNLSDSTDVLIDYLEYGDSLPCRVVFIDECQDLSYFQWRVLDKAFKYANKIYLAGDEKQSIYQFMGAEPKYLLDFAKKGNRIALADCRRNSKAVYELSKAVVSFMTEKADIPMKFHEGNPQGVVRVVESVDLLVSAVAETVKALGFSRHKSLWYLLGRSKHVLADVVERLEQNCVPYWNNDGFFMGGEIFNRIYFYYNATKLGFKPKHTIDAFKEKYGITDFSLPFTESNLFKKDRAMIYYQYVQAYGIETLKKLSELEVPVVLVSSIHGAKGGEAENVALFLGATKKELNKKFTLGLDEVLRILYVGITRALKNLYLMSDDSTRVSGSYLPLLTSICEENGIKLSQL